MILTDLFSMILRLAELAFAAIVAGLTGDYLHSVQGSSSWDQGRFIYTEVVAGLSIILSIIWLFPFSGSFIHWPADLFLSVAWFVAFGLIVNWYVLFLAVYSVQCGQHSLTRARRRLNGTCGLALPRGLDTLDTLYPTPQLNTEYTDPGDAATFSTGQASPSMV